MEDIIIAEIHKYIIDVQLIVAISQVTKNIQREIWPRIFDHRGLPRPATTRPDRRTFNIYLRFREMVRTAAFEFITIDFKMLPQLNLYLVEKYAIINELNSQRIEIVNNCYVESMFIGFTHKRPHSIILSVQYENISFNDATQIMYLCFGDPAMTIIDD